VEAGTMSSTAEVLDRHVACFGAGDLPGIMADYAEDAVLFLPGGLCRGTDAIRQHFIGAFAEFAKPGASFAMTHQAVDGPYAFIVWSAETADNVYELGTDTFVVQQGRIVAQTFAGRIIAK
jgi:ketosteroid isomerase-like protein